jgi:uncharacterized protein (TIGR02145 family)
MIQYFIKSMDVFIKSQILVLESQIIFNKMIIKSFFCLKIYNLKALANFLIANIQMRKELFYKLLLIGGLFLSVGIVACKKENGGNGENPSGTNKYLNPNLKYGSVTDVEGNKYATIQICSQTWMAENLRTTKYNDGTQIPHIKDVKEWDNLITGAFSAYDNFAENSKVYGMLYNWYTTHNGKLCPKGWHIPTDEEWKELEVCLSNNAGGKLKATGKSSDQTGLWESPNEGATNESGFAGLPGGGNITGSFSWIGSSGYWWTATEYNTSTARLRSLRYSSNNISNSSSYYNYPGNNKTDGMSCRCVRD